MSARGARRLIEIEPGTETIFTFDGSTISASSRDSVASALIASGIRSFGTTAQDGAPYGGYCFVGRCGECQVIVNGQPGVFACATTVEPGMTVETQHGHGHWEPKVPS